MKIVLIILGAVASAFAVGLIAAGFVIFGLVGSDGFIDSGTHPVSTPTRAIVSKTARITDEAERTGRLDRLRSAFLHEFTIRLQATPRGDQPVFVGVARAADVDAYLADVNREVVTNVEFDPFRLSKAPRAGAAIPAPPDQQDFWAEQAVGDPGKAATLDWKVREGNWRLVIMNADSSPTVRIDGLLGAKAAFARPLAFILLGVGLVALVVGVLLVVIGIRKDPEPKEPPVPVGPQAGARDPSGEADSTIR